jgi:NAD(P)H dehydrogenase (quinone)
MTIGITGASGHLGRLVIGELRKKVAANDIIALARTPASVADLGVSVRRADYDRPETLDSALAGVDTLLLISASEVGRRAPQHRNVIDAAGKAGVKRLIYTSLLHADTSEVGLADEHRETEAAIVASGIPYTILRNGWYTENYTAAVPGAVAGGAFIGSADGGRISSAARADYAAAAVAVLTSQGHEGKVYELAGDEAWTLSDLASEISRQTGREIPYRNLPVVEYAAVLAGFGLPEPVARTVAGFDVAASHDALFDDGHQLSGLIGRPTTPLADSVTEALSRSSAG